MFPELITSRLVLRRLAAADAESVFCYRSDPEVSRYQTWEPRDSCDVLSFIDRMSVDDPLVAGAWFQVGIVLIETGELIGDCGLHPRADDRRQVEVGVTVAPVYQGRGLALEALDALLGFLFTASDTHRVFCSVDPRNVACVRLMERVGMRKEAHHVQSLWVRTEWTDDLVFAILRKEWRKAAQPSATDNPDDAQRSREDH